MSEYSHGILPCGMEYAVCHLPRRHVSSFQLRVLAGTSNEPADQLGLAGVVEDAIDKGTPQFTGQALSDAFDAIGAGRNSGTGRETATFTCTVLPEHFDRAVALHAEFLRRPTFPRDAVDVSIELAMQEFEALEDDPAGLVDKYISRRAYGDVLGRHSLGEPGMVRALTREKVVSHWERHFHAGRTVAAISGPMEPARVAEIFQKHFDGWGAANREGRSPWPVTFTPGAVHHHKDLQQQQIGVCWPGVSATHEDFPVQQVTLGILSGGMSGRLFTEVREKRGLVYWVAAWQETPRGAGMIFLGASTTPERCELTYETLLGEVERLAEDITRDELDRAITGITAQQETRGDATRARCAELANDVFFYDRPVPMEEKVAKIKKVGVEDVRRYLGAHPRDRLCVVTLGPKALAGAEGGEGSPPVAKSAGRKERPAGVR